MEIAKTENRDVQKELTELFRNITTILNNYRIEIVQYNNSKNSYETVLSDLGLEKTSGQVQVLVPDVEEQNIISELTPPEQDLIPEAKPEVTDIPEFTPVVITEKMDVPEQDEIIEEKVEAQMDNKGIMQVTWTGSTETTIPGVGVATEAIELGKTYDVEYKDEMMGVNLYKFVGIEGLFEANLFNELDKTNNTDNTLEVSEAGAKELVVETELVSEVPTNEYPGMKATSINESADAFQKELKADFNGKGATIARGQGIIGLLRNHEVNLSPQAVIWCIWGIIELIDWSKSFYLISEARKNLNQEDIKSVNKNLAEINADIAAELTEAFETLITKMEDVETRTQAGLVIAEAEEYGMVI